jgi:hypothetical protein
MKPITDTLRSLRGGVLVDEATDALADVIEFLGADGVSASRVLHHERRTLRHYSLRLGSCTVQLHAYIHAAREAA